MYATEQGTARVRSGVRRGTSAAPAGCVPIPFLPASGNGDSRMEREGSRARGRCAGSVKTYHRDDATILAQKPPALRVAGYALLALTLTGVLPMLVVEAACSMLSALNARWLALPMVVAAMLLLVRAAAWRR